MKKLCAALCAVFALFTVACTPNKFDCKVDRYREYCIEEIGEPCKYVDFISVSKENDDYIYNYIITTEDGDIYYCSAVVDNYNEFMYIDCVLF